MKSYFFFRYHWMILIFLTRETRLVVPPCSKAGILESCQELHISLNYYSLFNHADFFSQLSLDNSEIFAGETKHIVPPCSKARIHAVDFMNNYD